MSLQEEKNAGSSPASQESFNYGENDRRQTARDADHTAAEFDKLSDKADEEKKTKKPGSQSQSNTDRHNNGRGGGK